MKTIKRKWYHRKKIIYSIHIIVFILFITIYEIYKYTENLKETENLSQFIQSFVWNLDDASANSYLEIYIQNNDISKIIILHPNNSRFLEIENKKTISIIEKILRMIFLIQEYKLQHSIYFEKEFIGYLEIYWINKNVYIYFYTLIIFILLSLIAFFYIETIKQKDQLNEAFREIKELNEQQNADYYLTSLLIKPLSYFKLESNYIQYNYYIEQKKKFYYKKYSNEIGGDYIILKKIQLKNRNYIFFINADAMGKSLQGGSGVLVLGSLLYAIHKRLEIRIEDKNKYPETWLKYLSLEIQELFESFQGSMMLSAVIGLIDEKSQILYYVNFEHPYPVLYRKGKAKFIGEEYLLRKIGTPKIFQENIKIQLLELYEQDVFIVGSDGKDDIEIGIKNNERIINEDETLFLKIVEQSEGDLSLIVENIKKTGNLTDDISILQFLIINKEIPVINNIPANQTNELLKKITNYVKNNQFEEVYKFYKSYIEEYPIDNLILYYYMGACYKLKKWDEAIEIGEKILNRTKIVKEVYPLLIKSYIKQKNYSRPVALLSEYKTISNNPEKIKELESMLNKEYQSISEKL